MSLKKYIPQVDRILTYDLFKTYNKVILKNITTKYLSKLRLDMELSNFIMPVFTKIIEDINNEYIKQTSYTLKPIINATGVVLHTNLGRSILSKELLDEISPILVSYSNLEYDLDNKSRGDRYSHIRSMLSVLFNVEDALIVNNNASAVFLILNTFANDKEVIISRGELVEIGGNFRIPEIMSSSNAILKEVGTTNKTKIRDYESAINNNTALIMKVHKSNYDIVGFTSCVDINEISKICNKYNLIDYYDLGSGYYGGIDCNEPSLIDIMKTSPSLVSFSGDKLFGSVQAGIILGKKKLIDELKKNHILRMLRVDKITISILQSTINKYINNDFDSIPTLRMLRYRTDELLLRANSMIEKIPRFFNPSIININGLAGGGSLPNVKFASIGIAILPKNMSAKTLESKLRDGRVISRILDSKVILDLRTIRDCEIDIIINLLHSIKKDYCE